jgi:serine protease Do
MYSTLRLPALLFVGAALLALAPLACEAAGPTFADVVDAVQPKIVKIYGAGGLRGLEAYQSGFLISGEGHVLTVWSYVLDSDVVTVTLDDGRKFEAKLLGADPRLEIALLKVDAENLPHFKLAEARDADVGTRVLAFNNLFGVATGNEPASVLHGSVAAVTLLQAGRGAFVTPYRGTVYILDAITNNPGAAGGALTNRRGELIGLTGKELRSSLSNTWLNYALPIDELRQSVDDLLAGKTLPRDFADRDKPARALELASLGLVLVPDVLDRTPPFIDRVRPNSPAAAASLRSDDLIIFFDGRLTQSCKDLRQEFVYTQFDAKIRLTVIRDDELIEVELQAPREEL